MRRWLRRLAWLALALLLTLAAALGAGYALLATPGGFALLADGVNRYSGGALRVEGARGHLGAPLTIRRIVVTTALRRIEVDGLRLEWRPRALRERRVEVTNLAASRLALIELKPAPDEPLTPPASLRLPFEVLVASVQLDELALVKPGGTLRLRDLRGRLDGRGGVWKLSGAAATTPWAGVRGALTLGKDAPYPLAGGIDLMRELSLPDAAGKDFLRARLALAGTLGEPAFDLQGAAFGLEVLAKGRAAPFARIKLPRLVVSGHGLDPRRFAPALPRARLAFSGVFQSDAADRLIGNFALDNALPGRLDQQGLPLLGLVAAVAGDAERGEVSALELDFGAAGKLAGEGGWQAGRFRLALDSPRIDLAALDPRLARTRLRLGLQLSGDAATQRLNLGLGDVWGAGWLALTRTGDVLELTGSRFAGELGRLVASGRWDGARRAFAARVDLAGFNPSRLGRFPAASLNLRGEVAGALRPELAVHTRFELPPGTLEGRPVSGRGRLNYARGRVFAAALDLALAGNRVKLDGAAGGPDDRLNWDIAAPALARLNLGLSGQLVSRGQFSGDWRAPQLRGRVEARALALPGGLGAAVLDLDADLTARAEGPFRAKLAVRGLVARQWRVESLHASLDGTRAAHRLELDAAQAGQRLALAARGGLDAVLTWQGTLERLRLAGDWPLNLLAPAPLLVSATHQRLRGLALEVAGARVEVDAAEHEQPPGAGRRWSTRGRFTRLALNPLLARWRPGLALAGDLVVGGDWALVAGATLGGRVALRRESGDLRLTDPDFALGLRTLALTATAQDSEVTARLKFDSSTRGELEATITTRLGLNNGVPALGGSAPLAGAVTARLPDLAAARPFLPLGMRANAALALDLTLSGSVARPRADGRLRADSIRFALPEEGVSIVAGMLDLKLAGDRVEVVAGELKGERGRIHLDGEARLDSLEGGLGARFERFALVNRSDRRIELSGPARLGYANRRLTLGGTLTVDRARLSLPEAARPRLSDDVIVAGWERKTGKPALPLDLDVRVDLGEDFLFDGAGLDARLAGDLRVYTRAGALRGEGAIRVAEGRYSAYGQSLDIQRGNLRFVGPLDNPGLDLLAVRKTPGVTAGVQVAGTVRAPRATLYSEPALPDAEKLSWLVLGRGLSGGGAREFALLQVAAGALLNRAQSVNVQAQLADRLGIDSFDVRAGEGETLESAVVAVGKRLSSTTLLSYEQSLDGLSRVVKVVHRLTRHLRLEAQTGAQTSFDAFYSVEYD